MNQSKCESSDGKAKYVNESAVQKTCRIRGYRKSSVKRPDVGPAGVYLRIYGKKNRHVKYNYETSRIRSVKASKLVNGYFTALLQLKVAKGLLGVK